MPTFRDVRQRLMRGESVAITSRQVTMVDLPLGATEDRVCGTIDIEKALFEGVKAFEPGLLAKANRGILYIDEVNLLNDFTRIAEIYLAGSSKAAIAPEIAFFCSWS
jgi:Mg-chelatase subunit ChlI